MNKYMFTAGFLVLATPAYAHHEEIVRQTAVAIDLGWPIVSVVVVAMFAQVRSWFRG